MKIYLRDLEAYKNASPQEKKHKLYCPNRSFDLGKLPQTDVVSEMKEYIEERGKKLKVLSIRTELYPYNLLCQFLSDEFPDMSTYKDVPENNMVQRARIWLFKNGKKSTKKRIKIETGKESVLEAELVSYIRKIYKYIYADNKAFNYDADRWYLADIPIEIKRNPVKKIESISFGKIIQPKMREEAKSVIMIHLAEMALGTVVIEITAVNRLSTYLSDRHPEVESLMDIDREIIEDYLIYINTEASSRKSYSKELYHLKSVFVTASKVLEYQELEKIFFRDDYKKEPEILYKVYSDDEIKRLNAAIIKSDEQIARALLIHQLLGTRISETLTLQQDAIRIDEEGRMYITIRQIKTNTSYEKAINEEVKILFDKACAYTNERYGKREYVFVNAKDPDMPMQYGRIHYQLTVMIRKNDMRDDNGELFGVGTHIWRHVYGKRLTELNVDDNVIAKLMGHATTASLKNYRMVGNEKLANDTRKIRQDKDKLLKTYCSE